MCASLEDDCVACKGVKSRDDGVELHWIPGHEQIPGNIRADKLALEARTYSEGTNKVKKQGQEARAVLSCADKRQVRLGERRTDEVGAPGQVA